MSRRRYDPDRRERIIEAAICVIAERGVSGTTSRAVAAAADVPLGSMTYHFASVDELLELAFTRVARRTQGRLDATIAAVDPTNHEAAQDALVRIICDEALGFEQDFLLLIELYTLALRRPAFRPLIQTWMEDSRRSLARLFPQELTAEISALIEGMVLHAHLGTESFSEERVRRAVARLTTESGVPGRH